MIDPDASDAELEAALARAMGRRRLALAGALVLVAASVGIGGYFLINRPPPLCQGDQVVAFLQSRAVPGAAIHRVCDLPGPLAEALRATEAAPPELARLLAMRAVAEAPELLVARCVGAPRALAEAIAVAPGEQTAVFLAGCADLEAGFADRATLSAAPLHRVVLALAVHTVLREAEPRADALARRVLEGP